MPLLIVLLVLVSCLPAMAQNALDPSQPIVRKQAKAIRVAPGSVNVDGRLDDAAWRDAVPLTDFWQREPMEGASPSDPIEVRLAYDDDALYVGARLVSSAPLQAPMGRRDEAEQSEYFSIMLDTYLDRRTAYEFGVTAAGVRLDWYYPEDNEREEDASFDPVWQARTSRDAQGWTAELWIPFSQLRFTARSPQVWGLNMFRWAPSRNEEVHWQEIPRTDQRLASRFGDLHGIDGIRPSRRIELMPYVASSSHLIGVREDADPFTGGANVAGRVGMDAKIGIGSNLTLEATVNPDFGQVEADPAEVNLSAFETFFAERRPFFVEGINLLQGTVNNFFYSRRIGASPVGRADGDFVDFPAQSSILGAAKLTGRLESGLSIGVLGALTAEETARTFNFPNTFGRVRVAPQTAYGVARLQQELGGDGSTAAVMVTGMHRGLPAGDPVGLRSTRNAFTVSGDSLLRLRDGDYELESYAGYSRVDGSAAAIDRVQRASARYLQRPDADYVVYDPTRTTLSGGKFGARFSRANARNWTWEIGTDIESPEFETNDIGRLNQGDGFVGQGQIQYEQTVPSRVLRDYTLFVDTRNEWNFGGERQQAQLSPGARLTWPNFWETEVNAEFRGRTQNQRLTRGGPLMQQPRSWNADIEVSNSEAAATRGQLGMSYGRSEDGGLEFGLESQWNMQPMPQLQVSITPEYSREVSTQQYVTALAGGPAAAFGRRYVFAHIDQSEYSTRLRMNYTFKPDLTLDFYGEPFSASGRYGHIGELVAARTRAMRLYGVEGTTITTLADGSRRVIDGAQAFALRNADFNVQSFRSNLVLRWEWRAGSTLYLVWQQDRESEIYRPFRTSAGDMFGSLGQDGDNFFAVKMTYWFSPN